MAVIRHAEDGHFCKGCKWFSTWAKLGIRTTRKPNKDIMLCVRRYPRVTVIKRDKASCQHYQTEQ